MSFPPTSFPSRSPSVADKSSYDPPSLSNSLENAIEGLGLEAFPEILKEGFYAQFFAFTLLYLFLALGITYQLCTERRRSHVVNRHYVLVLVLTGCVVRLCYVDTVDLVPSTPLEVEFVLRALKEVLWFASFAYLVFFWIEVLTTMRQRVTNIDQQRPKLMAAVILFTVLRASQVVGEFLRQDIIVVVAKSSVVAFLVIWVLFAGTWSRRLHFHLARAGTRLSTIKRTSRGARRLARFVIIELVLVLVLAAEFSFSWAAQERNRISLKTESSSGLVFALKVGQRSIEFLLMAVLAWTVRSTRHHRKRKKDGARKRPSVMGSNSTSSATTENAFFGGRFGGTRHERDSSTILTGMRRSGLRRSGLQFQRLPSNPSAGDDNIMAISSAAALSVVSPDKLSTTPPPLPLRPPQRNDFGSPTTNVDPPPECISSPELVSCTARLNYHT